MPGFAFTDLQMVTALAIGDIVPGPGSPLGMLRDFRRSAAPGDPDFDQLVELTFVRAGAERWELNQALAAVLQAAANPHEIIDVAFSDLSLPGVTIVRRDDLFLECTVGVGASVVKVYFPLTREAVLARVMEMFSGDRPLAPRTGFRFVGTADEVFVLAAVLRRLRMDLRPAGVDEVVQTVMADAADRSITLPFEALVGEGVLAGLVHRPDVVRSSLEGLVADGHLVVTSGLVSASDAASTVLDAGLGPSVAVSRGEVHDGVVRRTTVRVMRCGRYLLTFRTRTPAGGPIQFEWAEVDRVQLRWLMASILLPPDELAELVAAAEGPAAPLPDADAPPAPRPATAPVAAVAVAVAVVWAATHRTPATGMAAWDLPDGRRPPVASLDPYLPVRVDGFEGAFAAITCENGWSGWVDGRLLT